MRGKRSFSLLTLFVMLNMLLSQVAVRAAASEPQSQSNSYTMRIEPIADTYVAEMNPWRNNQWSPQLCVWSSHEFPGAPYPMDNYTSFLKFDLTDIQPYTEIKSAVLFIRVFERSVESTLASVIGAHQYSDNSWAENRLVWATVNWDALDQTLVDTVRIDRDTVQRQSWFSWLVTEEVDRAKGRLLTLALRAENEVESIFFHSRETSFKPYILINPRVNLDIYCIGNDGRALRGATIELYDTDNHLAGTAGTSSTGWARFEGIYPDRYRIAAGKEGWRLRTVERTVRGEDLTETIMLEPITFIETLLGLATMSVAIAVVALIVLRRRRIQRRRQSDDTEQTSPPVELLTSLRQHETSAEGVEDEGLKFVTLWQIKERGKI